MKTTWPKSTARDVLPAIALALGSAYLLFRFPPAYQSWDALVYAHRAQTHQLAASLYSHHALSNLLFYAAGALLPALGLVGESVAAFQVVNAILGGAVVGVLYALARRWGNARFVAAALALLLLASYGFWHFAGLADLYIWIILVTLLFWESGARAVMRLEPRQALVAGGMAALAILSWQPNVILAALFGFGLLWSARRQKVSAIRPILFYGITGAALLLLGYLGLGWLAGVRSGPQLWAWFVGYFASSTWGHRLSFDTWALVRDVAQSAVITPDIERQPYRLAWEGMWLGVALFAMAVAWGAWRARHAQRLLLSLTLTWVLILAAASWWFDPRSPKFWLVVWLGCLILAILTLAQWPSTRLFGLPLLPTYIASLSLTLLVFNFIMGILPEHRLPNYQIEAARVWQAQTRPNDLLIVGYDFSNYLNYYAQRERLVCPECATNAGLGSDAQATAQWAQAAISAALADGAVVYRAENSCLSPREDLMSWCSAELLAVFNAYGWSPAFTTSDGIHTYTVYQTGGEP